MIGYQDKSSLIPKDKYLFSVTQVSEFFLNPNEFFRKVIKKEKIDFYNTQTVLGTLIHYAISQMYEKKKVHKEEVYTYLDSIPDEFEVDKQYVKDKYYTMRDQVLSYAKGLELESPTEWEKNYILKLTNNVYIGGTIDARYDNLLIDFKTSSKLTLKPEDELPQKYIDQLYTYSYILHQHSIPVDKCNIVYFTIPEVGRISEKTGKRLKDYPLQFIRKEFYLNEETMKQTKDRIYFIANTIEYILKHPESFNLFARIYGEENE